MKNRESCNLEASKPILGEDIHYYENLIWEHAEETNNVRIGLQEKINEIYDELSAQDFKCLNLHQRELHADKEKIYWDLNAQLQALRSHEDELMRLLELIVSDQATLQDINALLPQQTSDEIIELSKKKRAIQRERERFGVDQRAIASELLLYGINFIPATDPRRISSGRNRRSITSANGMDRFSAESAFYDVTADTHGGKVRRNGKNGRNYVGQDGRKIRKR